MEIWRLATCGHGLHRSSIFVHPNKRSLWTSPDSYTFDRRLMSLNVTHRTVSIVNINFTNTRSSRQSSGATLSTTGAYTTRVVDGFTVVWSSDIKSAPESAAIATWLCIHAANNHSRRSYSCARRRQRYLVQFLYDASESATEPLAPSPSTETDAPAFDPLGERAVKGRSRIHRGMFARGNSCRRSETASGLQPDCAEAKHRRGHRHKDRSTIGR